MHRINKSVGINNFPWTKTIKYITAKVNASDKILRFLVLDIKFNKHIFFMKEKKVKVKSLSHVWLFVMPWTVACTRLLHPWDFLGKSTGVGCHFLHQGIFPTQEWNPGLPHCRHALPSEPPGKSLWVGLKTYVVLYQDSFILRKASWVITENNCLLLPFLVSYYLCEVWNTISTFFLKTDRKWG